MRCCLPSCAAPRKLKTGANNKSKTAGGRRFIAPYLRTHTRAWKQNLVWCFQNRRGARGNVVVSHFPGGGEPQSGSLYRISLLREQDPAPEFNSPETCP